MRDVLPVWGLSFSLNQNFIHVTGGLIKFYYVNDLSIGQHIDVAVTIVDLMLHRGARGDILESYEFMDLSHR